MIRPIIVITHASFDERRRWALNRLTTQLRLEAPDIPFEILSDHNRKGSLWNWLRAMRAGLDDGMTRDAPGTATHIVWLPDDALVCKDFGAILRACIEARPDDVFDCYVNHTAADELKTLWYSTPDGGFVGMGGVFPRALLEEHLEWRKTYLADSQVTNDGGVNLWSMTRSVRIYKTAWTLVDHDASMPSLDGNGSHAHRVGQRPIAEARTGILADLPTFLGRTYRAPEEHAPGVRRAFTELPNAYEGNHWLTVKELPAAAWDLDEMYSVARNGEPVVAPSLLILTPSYRMPTEMLEKTRASVEAVRAHLAEHSIPTGYMELRGDALVCRMRQRGCNIFLKSQASHVLWWDGDIECLTPECVLAMMQTGHDVITGAVPFKTMSGDVVCNLLLETREALARGDAVCLEGGCLEVQDAGSGFMLVSRKALYLLQQEHPELLHFSASKSDYGEPLWALFDTAVVDKLYRSEDYYFCHLWRQDGGKVYVYEPARFRHYGVHGFEGSLRQQFGLEKAAPSPDLP